jgi:hypothetical protein
MAQHKSRSSVVVTSANRLADKTPIRITPHPESRKLAVFRFRVHDSEEIGPRMLARIAKNTGLRPEDL